jgi:hypothetical protein
MGADFIGCLVPITRTREEAVEVLRTLDEDSIKRALYNTNLDSEWAEDGDDDDEGVFWSFPEDGGEPTLIMKNIVRELETYVNIVYDIAEDKHRVASWFRHDEVLFVVTGGLSWGDSPDFYDEMSIVYFLGVTYDPTMELTWVKRAVPDEA